MHTLRAALPLVFLLAACADDSESGEDPCVPGAVTVAVTTPVTYLCTEPYKAAFAVTNGSCDPVTVTNVRIATAVTAGPCGAPATGNYAPTTATVAPGATVTVLDLTTGAFCCLSPGCPDPLDCTEASTFTLFTSAGNVTANATYTLDLDACTVICT